MTQATSLLAHWQYRGHNLYRDLNKAKDTRAKVLRGPRKSDEYFPSDHIEPTTQDLPSLEAEIACLEWLYSEAEYTAICLDLEIRYDYLATANDKLDAYLDNVAVYSRPTPPATEQVVVIVDGVTAVCYPSDSVDDTYSVELAEHDNTVVVRLTSK